ILTLAERFRMDNNLTDFGNGFYQPDLPINIVYDTFAVPAALIRGLFEYLYRADGLTILPHIPPGITELEQAFPVRFGASRLYLSAVGSGPVTGVRVNGKPWKWFNGNSITFAPESLPAEARVEILLGGARRAKRTAARAGAGADATPAGHEELQALNARAQRMIEFHRHLVAAGLGSSYEAAHAQVAIDMVRAANERFVLRDSGKLKPLPDVSQRAADKLYVDVSNRLMDGLERAVRPYEKSTNARQKRVHEAFVK
ncbi:MAG TPA: hypothetical protein PKJ41_19615, partial [Bryobacteraceae bacterium]|nr:hypothetical protein [Bryobacteraceae bacterium]